EELTLLGREPARPKHTDVQHAQELALEQEGHAQERTDSFLAQERVEHLAVVDVLEHDRPALGRDPSRESLSHRNAHPALDLLLEPSRPQRDQHVALLEEDRRRVHRKYAPDATEQLAQ